MHATLMLPNVKFTLGIGVYGKTRKNIFPVNSTRSTVRPTLNHVKHPQGQYKAWEKPPHRRKGSTVAYEVSVGLMTPRSGVLVHDVKHNFEFFFDIFDLVTFT